MKRIVHDLISNTPEWHAFRGEHDGASEIAAVLGLSKNVTRTELLHMKATGLPREFSDFVQKNILDKGHEVEAMTRPLVEAVIGNDLYAVTMSFGRQSASCDGLTAAGETGWENKQWNEAYAAMVAAGVMPEEHMPQVQQGLKVTGAKRWIFSISDGTPDKFVWMEVLPDQSWFDRVDAGWVQFNADRAAYVPVEIIEKPKAKVKQALPALFIHAKGEITADNLPEYGLALAAELKSIRSIALVTDQDFSNAKASAQFLRDQIQSAKLTKEAMLAQTATVGEAARMIDAWCEDMRMTALQLEKDVEREDRAKKESMILAARQAYSDHVASIEVALQPIRLAALSAPNFADAIKGKRNYASMHDAINTALANGKIAADAMGKDYSAKKVWLESEAHGCMSLFPDAQALMLKPMDDFQLVVKMRVAAKVADDAEREDKSRERIRLEEKAKAESKACAKLMAEFDAQSELDEQASVPQQTAPQILQKILQAIPAPAAQTPPSMKLGDLNAMLSPITLTADGLEALGFPVAATVKNAKLYHASDLTRICGALIDLINRVQAKQAA